VMCVVFAAGTPLLSGLAAVDLDVLSGCPLLIFAPKHADILAKLRKRAQKVMGYQTIVTLGCAGIVAHPFTRAQMMTTSGRVPCLCLASTDVEGADRLDAACLSELLFGNGRLGGKQALWKLVVLMALRGVEYVTSDVDVDACIRRLVLHTPDRQRVCLGLSALGNQPTNPATVYEALLWAVLSTTVYLGHPTKDVMRHLLPAAEVIRDVLALVHCPELATVDAVERFDARVARLRARARQIAAVKAIVGDDVEGDGDNLTPRQALMCEVASHFTARSFGDVLRDGRQLRPPTAEEAMLLEAAADSSPGQSFGKAVVSKDAIAVPVGGLYNAAVNDATITDIDHIAISPGSLRPFVNPDGKPWMAAAEDSWGPFASRVNVIPAVPSFHRLVAQETIGAGGVVPDPDDDAHVERVVRDALHQVARKLRDDAVVPTVPASMDAMYRACLRQVHAALETRRALGLPSEPANVRRVMVVGSSRAARAALERTS
jgi:hypothetical protein